MSLPGKNPLSRLPRSKLRKVTRAERLATPSLSPKGDYFVAKGVRHIGPKTRVITVTRWKAAKAGVSHGTIARQHLAGTRPYKSAASEARARAQRATAQVKRDAQAVQTVERPRDRRHPEGIHHVSDFERRNFMRTRREKLIKGWVEDDLEWLMMIRIAEEINDPKLTQLRASP